MRAADLARACDERPKTMWLPVVSSTALSRQLLSEEVGSTVTWTSAIMMSLESEGLGGEIEGRESFPRIALHVKCGKIAGGRVLLAFLHLFTISLALRYIDYLLHEKYHLV